MLTVSTSASNRVTAAAGVVTENRSDPDARADDESGDAQASWKGNEREAPSSAFGTHDAAMAESRQVVTTLQASPERAANDCWKAAASGDAVDDSAGGDGDADDDLHAPGLPASTPRPRSRLSGPRPCPCPMQQQKQAASPKATETGEASLQLKHERTASVPFKQALCDSTAREHDDNGSALTVSLPAIRTSPMSCSSTSSSSSDVMYLDRLLISPGRQLALPVSLPLSSSSLAPETPPLHAVSENRPTRTRTKERFLDRFHATPTLSRLGKCRSESSRLTTLHDALPESDPGNAAAPTAAAFGYMKKSPLGTLCSPKDPNATTLTPTKATATQCTSFPSRSSQTCQPALTHSQSTHHRRGASLPLSNFSDATPPYATTPTRPNALPSTYLPTPLPTLPNDTFQPTIRRASTTSLLRPPIQSTNMSTTTLSLPYSDSYPPGPHDGKHISTCAILRERLVGLEPAHSRRATASSGTFQERHCCSSSSYSCYSQNYHSYQTVPNNRHHRRMRSTPVLTSSFGPSPTAAVDIDSVHGNDAGSGLWYSCCTADDIATFITSENKAAAKEEEEEAAAAATVKRQEPYPGGRDSLDGVNETNAIAATATTATPHPFERNRRHCVPFPPESHCRSRTEFAIPNSAVEMDMATTTTATTTAMGRFITHRPFLPLDRRRSTFTTTTTPTASTAAVSTPITPLPLISPRPSSTNSPNANATTHAHETLPKTLTMEATSTMKQTNYINMNSTQQQPYTHATFMKRPIRMKKHNLHRRGRSLPVVPEGTNRLFGNDKVDFAALS